MKLQHKYLLLLLCSLLSFATSFGQGTVAGTSVRVFPATSMDQCDGEIDMEGERGTVYSLYSAPEMAWEATGYPFLDLCPGSYVIRACSEDGKCRWMQEIEVPVAVPLENDFPVLTSSAPISQ